MKIGLEFLKDSLNLEVLLTRRAEGTGIGLTLVKSLVKLHNGEVYVNTELKKELNFVLNCQ